MLILDKQKAIERVVALTAGLVNGVSPEVEQPRPHARTYQRIATYERRPMAVPIVMGRRSAERRRIRYRTNIESAQV